MSTSKQDGQGRINQGAKHINTRKIFSIVTVLAFAFIHLGQRTALGTTLQSVLGTSTITSETSITNAVTQDGGQLITTAVSGNYKTALTPINSTLRDVVISNTVSAIGSVTVGVTVGANQYVTNIEMRDVKIYGTACAVELVPNSTGQDIGRFYNSEFYALNYVFHAYHLTSQFESCRFSATASSQYLLTNGQDYAYAFIANDNSTNTFNNCTFEYGGSTNESIGVIPYAFSFSEFNNCRFISRTKAAHSVAVLWSGGESFVTARFRDCFFELNGGQLFEFDAYDGDHILHELTFQNCFVVPYTNGILVNNTNWIVNVIGGNLAPSNFSHPSNVVWGKVHQPTNTAYFTIITNALSIGETYTNGPVATMNSVTFAVSPTAATDFPQIDLLIDWDGNNTWDFKDSRVSADISEVAMIVTAPNFVFPLQPGSRYMFSTNNASGDATIVFYSRTTTLR